MTVAELIELLSHYPGQAVVCVSGHESGYELLTPKNIFTVKVQEVEYAEYFERSYDDAKKVADPGLPVLLACVLSRPIKPINNQP